MGLSGCCKDQVTWNTATLPHDQILSFMSKEHRLFSPTAARPYRLFQISGLCQVYPKEAVVTIGESRARPKGTAQKRKRQTRSHDDERAANQPHPDVHDLVSHSNRNRYHALSHLRHGSPETRTKKRHRFAFNDISLSPMRQKAARQPDHLSTFISETG